MRNLSEILNLLLATALLVLTVKITLGNTSKSSPETETQMKQNSIEVLMTRTSVRNFTDRAVEPEKVEQLLRAAMAAPTAGNKQPWSFIVVNDKDLLEKIGETLPYAKMTSSAPLAIIACGDLSKAYSGIEAEYWIQDVSAASENILLAAHTLGLGAVWTGVYPVRDRINAVRDLLQLPESIVPLNVIPIGYPAKTTTPKEKWKEENVHYNGFMKPSSDSEID